ncbi:hypothetical protein [Clostridium sp. C2-6-12]|uniref:hypothetical protein n=1 Tax=Clostridium sp. C2-6-12 TaxID=2698832 RepID=UPI00136921E9|nr:hypothetical protein [Clostridium sp. C2-6-12]
MQSNLKPYLQIKSIRIILRLYDIDVRRNIKAGYYLVLVNNLWNRIEVCEPLISTSGRPIRALNLYGSQKEAEKLLVLGENLLKGNTSSLQMKDESGEKFEVYFNKDKVRSWFYVSGEFLGNDETEEFQCLFKFSNGKKVIGTALNERKNGKQELFISEITTEEKIQLIHAINEGEKIALEKIDWV